MLRRDFYFEIVLKIAVLNSLRFYHNKRIGVVLRFQKVVQFNPLVSVFNQPDQQQDHQLSNLTNFIFKTLYTIES